MKNRAKLGEVEFSVIEEESPEITAEITERTVERGSDIVDHVRVRPIVLNISGVIVGDDAGQKLSKLREYARKGEVLRYVGRNIFANMVIQSLPTQHTVQIRNGFSFRMVLNEIRLAKPQTVSYIASDPVKAKITASTQVKKLDDKGLQQKSDQPVDKSQKQSWLLKTWESAKSYIAKLFAGKKGGGGR